MLDVLLDRRTPSNARAASMSSPALINSLPIRPDDSDFFAADACELYRHADEPIFLFLIVGGEGILVHHLGTNRLCSAGGIVEARITAQSDSWHCQDYWDGS
jgi:hypothetical protein